MTLQSRRAVPTARWCGKSSANYTVTGEGSAAGRAPSPCDNRAVSTHAKTSLVMGASPYLLLTLTPLFWAGNWIIGRGLHSEIPPMAMTFFRWFFAVLILAPFALPQLRSDWP